jgi:hypothetical protein
MPAFIRSIGFVLVAWVSSIAAIRFFETETCEIINYYLHYGAGIKLGTILGSCNIIPGVGSEMSRENTTITTGTAGEKMMSIDRLIYNNFVGDCTGIPFRIKTESLHTSCDDIRKLARDQRPFTPSIGKYTSSLPKSSGQLST